MYVYIKTEPELWTVGHYAPDGKWHSESDHGNREDAAQRVAWLNGGKKESKDTPEEEEKYIRVRVFKDSNVNFLNERIDRFINMDEEFDREVIDTKLHTNEKSVSVLITFNETVKEGI